MTATPFGVAPVHVCARFYYRRPQASLNVAVLQPSRRSGSGGSALARGLRLKCATRVARPCTQTSRGTGTGSRRSAPRSRPRRPACAGTGARSPLGLGQPRRVGAHQFGGSGCGGRSRPRLGEGSAAAPRRPRTTTGVIANPERVTKSSSTPSTARSARRLQSSASSRKLGPHGRLVGFDAATGCPPPGMVRQVERSAGEHERGFAAPRLRRPGTGQRRWAPRRRRWRRRGGLPNPPPPRGVASRGGAASVESAQVAREQAPQALVAQHATSSLQPFAPGRRRCGRGLPQVREVPRAAGRSRPGCPGAGRC